MIGRRWFGNFATRISAVHVSQQQGRDFCEADSQRPKSRSEGCGNSKVLTLEYDGLSFLSICLHIITFVTATSILRVIGLVTIN